METKRLRWIDGMGGLAILWVLLVHFISVFTTNSSAIFPGFLGKLLFGVSGKLAVAFFCVALGYFASKPSAVPLWRYGVKHYLSFAQPLLIIELLYCGAGLLLGPDSYLQRHCPLTNRGAGELAATLLGDSFAFSAQLIPTYWCMDDFLLGSLLAFGAARAVKPLPLRARLLICLALLAGCILLERVWIAACLMGYLLRLALECDFSFWKRPALSVLLLLPIPYLIRRNECALTYLLDGVACLLMLYVCFQCAPLQKIFSFRPIAWLGGLTLELFLLHVPIYQIVRSLLQPLYARPLATWEHALLFPPVLALTVLLAFGWKKLLSKISVGRLIDKIPAGRASSQSPAHFS